jgi:hypothetical protein
MHPRIVAAEINGHFNEDIPASDIIYDFHK